LSRFKEETHKKLYKGNYWKFKKQDLKIIQEEAKIVEMRRRQRTISKEQR